MDRNAILTSLLSMVAHTGTLPIKDAHASLKDHGAKKSTMQRAIALLLEAGTLSKDGTNYKVASPQPLEQAITDAVEKQVPQGTELKGDKLVDKASGVELDADTGEPKEENVKKTTKAKGSKKAPKVKLTKAEKRAADGGKVMLVEEVLVQKEVVKVKIDGKRTSAEGCLARFREMIQEAKDEETELNREEVIQSLVDEHGPKSKWATANYISLAKAGKLEDCYVLTEDEEGALSVGKYVPRKKKARKAAAAKEGAK